MAPSDTREPIPFPTTAHDGLGMNVLVLFFGWLSAPICFGIAGRFQMKQEEKIKARKPSAPLRAVAK
jgi:hypothetical protein